MKTQQEQLKEAKFAYLVPLNVAWTRWAVYLDDQDGKGLRPFWPSDSHEGKKSKELIPGQIYSKAEHYCAFHFHLTGCGYSKTDKITRTLHTVNPKLIVCSGLQYGTCLHRKG